VFADLPGARPEEIDVHSEDGVLSLHASVQPRPLPGRMLKQEFGVGDYRRSLKLKIRVPRMAAVRPRKIAVSPR
jgi:HSP20 family molecular chaperone IbpA